MEAVDSEVDGRALSCLDDLLFHLFFDFRHNLLDACRVDTSVDYELMQSKTCYFTSDGIEP